MKLSIFLDVCILAVLTFCFSASGATYPNLFTTNANPGSVNWTNAGNIQAATANTTGNATVGGTLGVTGTATLSGAVNVGGKVTGNLGGGTNILGLGFSSGAATATSTNLNVVVSNIYQTITLAADCNVTNVSGTGSASVKFIPGGSNRVMSFPTNWCWLSTNGFALSGSLYSITLTNAASKIGWLSVYNSGTDPTNVAAAYRQTP